MVNPILAPAAIVQTQEEERYRLAYALQSGPAQVLANAALEIETCLGLMDEQPQAAREGLTALMHELRAGLEELRGLVVELQPPLLDELGLAAGLQKYAAHFSKRTGIAVTLIGVNTFTERLPATLELSVFRIAQEAFENVHQHAHAQRLQLELKRTDDQLKMIVTDDGKGFESQPAKTAERRLGLVAMRDRADLLGGTLQVFSEPGQGVQVVLTAPLRLSASVRS
jgi:two-component system sensor histidine kinase DegS